MSKKSIEKNEKFCHSKSFALFSNNFLTQKIQKDDVKFSLLISQYCELKPKNHAPLLGSHLLVQESKILRFRKDSEENYTPVVF